MLNIQILGGITINFSYSKQNTLDIIIGKV